MRLAIPSLVLIAAWLIVGANCQFTDSTGEILVYNWVYYEYNMLDRYTYLCNTPKACDCVVKHFNMKESSSHSSESSKEKKESQRRSKLKPNEVKNLICSWPASVPEFNVMFRTKYTSITERIILQRNCSVWDIDRLFTLHTDEVIMIRSTMIEDMRQAGSFGQLVGDDQGMWDFLAIEAAIFNSRNCVEEEAGVRW